MALQQRGGFDQRSLPASLWQKMGSKDGSQACCFEHMNPSLQHGTVSFGVPQFQYLKAWNNLYFFMEVCWWQWCSTCCWRRWPETKPALPNPFWTCSGWNFYQRVACNQSIGIHPQASYDPFSHLNGLSLIEIKCFMSLYKMCICKTGGIGYVYIYIIYT